MAAEETRIFLSNYGFEVFPRFVRACICPATAEEDLMQYLTLDVGFLKSLIDEEFRSLSKGEPDVIPIRRRILENLWSEVIGWRKANDPVDWIILPGGDMEDEQANTSDSAGPRGEERVDWSRIEYIRSLCPNEEIEGSIGPAGYHAFLFGSVAVLDRPVYGNAIYVLYRNWVMLSRRMKRELMSYGPEYVKRIAHTHTGAWKDELKKVVVNARSPRPVDLIPDLHAPLNQT